MYISTYHKKKKKRVGGGKGRKEVEFLFFPQHFTDVKTYNSVR